ncbi:hypothetical protein D3C83_42880 [compost metagenome]
MSEGVIFIEAIMRRRLPAAMISASILSWSRQYRMSSCGTFASNSSRVTLCSVSGFTSTSATARSRSIALAPTGWVMKIRGLAMTVLQV